MRIFADSILHDKVVLVTGGGTGIGRGIALGMAAYGAHLVLASRNKALLKRSLLGQLLTQACSNDFLVARLKINGVDGNFVEVAALMGSLLHVDVGLTLGQCHLDSMA